MVRITNWSIVVESSFRYDDLTSREQRILPSSHVDGVDKMKISM
jgi:hypothetical protein